jgi:hypothetical protein
MIVSKEYAAEWGLVAKKDDEEVAFERLDLGAGKLVVLENDAEVDHDLADYVVDKLEFFKLMHGG